MLVDTENLVFDEILRLEHFPQVVIVGGDAHQQRIGPCRFGRGFRESPDHETVMVRPGRLH